MNEIELIKNAIQDSIKTKERLSGKDLENILKIKEVILESLKKNGTIYLFGNGGSAADAQHVAAEFVGRFQRERKPLSAEALTTNTSILTALGNDYNFNEIFMRQVKARAKPIDVAVGISTSGKSKNVLLALEEAKKIGAKTIGFTGSNTNMNKIVDVCLNVPSDSTSRIQEAHILIWHIICDLVERSIVE